ncbi:beta-galactosidase [Cohnella lupini]|uniref:beta-galactosidase n=1 Tax=Cohnella lupini TaxID=1294267 RepID=A0A3D9ITN6_9BACL|nr:beta-galactosidase [Cohnella lupini]RED64879.1 beta-galactosidase GanA [Cohnella lupini]
MPERVRIGSQLFINKDDTPEYVKRMVVSMKENGLEIIRLFMIWEQLEPSDGKWSFDNYDACFEQAALSGLTVVPTLMSVSPPGWMRLTEGPQSLADLDDPVFHERTKAYIEKIVARYGNHSQLDSWILWNEPSREIYKTPHAIKAYSRYLQEVYGTIEEVNKGSYTQYSSFEELEKGMGRTLQSYVQPFVSFNEQLEWIRFTVRNMEEQLIFIRDEIRKLDPVHPVHVNPHNIQLDMQRVGQSVWMEADLVDFMGCSAHPMWHSLRYPEQRWTQSVGYFSDLMKSATRDPERKFWVSELQGGTTLYSSEKAYTPSGTTIKHWIWEGIGSGAKAVVFWCFNSRNAGYEAGEWSLLNQLEKPSPRLLAAKHAAEIIGAHEALFSDSTPERGKVLILFSERSMSLGQVEGEGLDPSNPRNGNMYADAVAGAHLLLSDLSVTAELISDKRLAEEGIREEIRALIVPNAIVLGAGEIAAIESFVSRGGIVIADGLSGMKDENGKLAGESLRRLAALFGAEVEDIETADDGLELYGTGGELALPGWFYRLPLEIVGADVDVSARFADGRPAVTSRKYGEGSAIRIGTNAFQRYFAMPDAVTLNYVESIVRDAVWENIQLVGDSAADVDADTGAGVSVKMTVKREAVGGLRLKTLNHPEGKILVFINESSRRTAKVSFTLAGLLNELSSDTESAVLEISAGSVVELNVEENGVSVYGFKSR